MLPSRAAVRSGPLMGLRRQLHGRCANHSGTISRRLSHGRRFGSLPPCHLSGCSSSPSPLRVRSVAGPILLGGVASSRQLSLWGFGRKNSPQETASPTPESIPSAAAPAPAPAPEAAQPIDPAPDVDLSSISDIVNGQDILNMPEKIGFLHALGLDFGWGPTSMMQWTLEHVHIYTGLGWGASIMATAILLRCLMVYPQVHSLKFTAAMTELRKDPRSQEAVKLTQQGFLNGDMEMRQRGQYINKMLKEQYGVSNLGMLWSFGQIPFTFGLFRIVSGMANVPVPAMENAGFLWFSDLTATDPYFILPAAGTALMVGALAVNAKNTPSQQKQMLKTMTYIFGIGGFIATSFLSAAVNLMTVALGSATLLTAVILNNALVRRTVGLPAHPPTATPKATYEAPRAAPTATTKVPEAGLRERLNTNLNEMKKGFSEQISNYTGGYSATEQEKAEKKRKELIRKLEETRKQQEREEFERKYKGKR